MTVVQNTAARPDGTPLASATVAITLMTAAPAGGFTPVGGVPTATATTDKTGHWSADLKPNAAITPAGTFYRVSEQKVIAITVPATGGPYNLYDSLIQASPQQPRATALTGVQVAVGGTLAGSRPEINLIAGSGATLSATDDPAANSVDVTVSATSTTAYSRQILVSANGAASTVVTPVGVWTPTYIADPAYYGWVNQSDGAQGDTVTFDTACDAGTYTFELFHLRFQSRGIYTVKIDGTTAGTIDGFAASLTPTRSALPGITLSAGQHTITLAMLTQNASATGFIGQVERLALTRTA